MLALSASRPWDWVILHTPFKDVENRRWPTRYRGRICIHRAKSKDIAGFRWMMAHRHELGLGDLVGTKFAELSRVLADDCPGGLVGEVDIVDCVTHSDSPWFSGPYGFVLANPEAYDEPIPCPGALKLFTVPETNGLIGKAGSPRT